MYPKSRIDALTDGLFGVAMTILVLDVRLPDGVEADQASLVGALLGLWPKFLPYALSFYVLGSTWLTATCLPFSTSVVGHYAHVKAAVWLYSLNMAALAVLGHRWPSCWLRPEPASS